MSDKLLDFVEKRKENIEQKRRSFERLLFHSLLGAYAVIDGIEGIYPIELVDISKDGCLFQLPWNVKRDKKIPKGTELTIRMYFTSKSYIPVIVKTKYSKEFIDKDDCTYMQYGCEFDRSMPSFAALEDFIRFMYSFAEHSAIDHGDAKVYF